MTRLFGALLAGCWLLAGCDSQTGEIPADAIATPAQRIITLAPHLTELVFAVDAGDRLVGVVDFSDYPPAALKLRRIGDSFRVDYEVVLELQPDLILAWGSGTPVGVRERLSEMGFRVVPLEAASLDEIASQLTEIGHLTGTSATANLVAHEFADDLHVLRTQYRDAAPVDVFYQIAAQPLFTVSDEHVISEAIEVCGGRNVFADIDGVSPAVTLEAVLAAAPDAIVAGQDANNRDQGEELRRQWSRWQSVPAVRDGHVFTVDADRMHRSTTRILGAVAELCVHLDRVRRDRTGGA